MISSRSCLLCLCALALQLAVNGEVLFVANYGNGTVEKIDERGNSTIVGSGFHSPIGLTFDASGNLYVGEWDSGRIVRIDPAGNRVAVADVGLWGPMGIAIGPDGKTYVAHRGRNQVIAIAPGGAQEVVGSVTKPAGLAFDSAGNLFVASQEAEQVVRFTPEGSRSVFADSADGIAQPTGLTFDPAGNLYVANYVTGRIIRFDPSGNGAQFAQVMPGYSNPGGLTFGPDGNLYAGLAGNKIERFGANGVGELFAETRNGPWFIAFQPVPEPSLLMLAGIGVAGLWVREKFRLTSRARKRDAHG